MSADLSLAKKAAEPIPSKDDASFLLPADADAAILVGINQRGGLGAKLQARGGAGERDPQLLVQLVEVQQVGSGFEFDLVKAAGAKKFPGV